MNGECQERLDKAGEDFLGRSILIAVRDVQLSGGEEQRTAPAYGKPRGMIVLAGLTAGFAAFIPHERVRRPLRVFVFLALPASAAFYWSHPRAVARFVRLAGRESLD